MKSSTTPIFEAGKREQSSLDSFLRQTSPRPRVEQVSVHDARQAEKLAVIETGRTAIRVLFITTDTAILTQATKSLDGYLPLADIFDEVHILVLRTGIASPHPALRIAPNAWIYTATAKQAWGMATAGWELLQEHFVFADGFRPDLVVARDPYESALLATWAGDVYDRPLQLHLTVAYEKERRHPKQVPWWRRVLAWYTMPRFPSIRTETESLKAVLRQQYGEGVEVASLPHFRDYTSLLEGERQRYLQTKYSQFTFIIVYFGPLSHDSTAWRVLDAVRDAFRNPRLGLVVVGDGPARAEFSKRAALLGIAEQVVFERTADDQIAYLRSADLVVVTDLDERGDEVALYSAATAAPIVMTETASRHDIFTSGQSALIVAPDAPRELSTAIQRVVSDNVLRRALGDTARQVVASRLHVDPAEYQAAYRESVETAILTHNERADMVQ